MKFDNVCTAGSDTGTPIAEYLIYKSQTGERTREKDREENGCTERFHTRGHT